MAVRYGTCAAHVPPASRACLSQAAVADERRGRAVRHTRRDVGCCSVTDRTRVDPPGTRASRTRAMQAAGLSRARRNRTLVAWRRAALMQAGELPSDKVANGDSPGGSRARLAARRRPLARTTGRARLAVGRCRTSAPSLRGRPGRATRSRFDLRGWSSAVSTLASRQRGRLCSWRMRRPSASARLRRQSGDQATW